MPANEIAERLAAACWVRCGPADPLGEGNVNLLAAGSIAFRSRTGFQNRIITGAVIATNPLVLLPLDKTYSRRETAVLANRLATVDTPSRLTYPSAAGVFPAVGTLLDILVQPIMLEWMGPDLAVPLWVPFGLNVGLLGVAAGFDLDLFDTIAVMLPVDDLVTPAALSGDFSVLVMKHPLPEGVDTIDAVLPAAVP